jgi:hemoglobin-like flavoprotein
MNREHSLRIKASWQRLKPDAPRVAELFYARLFELDSWMQEPLGEDWRTGGAGWIALMSAVVDNLEDPVALRALIHKEVLANDGWGLREDDLYLVGLALFAALEEELGAAFTSSVRHAWGLLYGELAQELLSAINKTAA